MEFIETPVFTKLILELLPDDSYRLLQDDIAKNPQAGDLIPAGGGIRKLRFALPGMGKRGGARLIYYWQTSKHKDLHAAGVRQGKEREPGAGAGSDTQGIGKGVGMSWIKNFLNNCTRA